MNDILDFCDQRKLKEVSKPKETFRYKEVNCAIMKGMKAAKKNWTERQ